MSYYHWYLTDAACLTISKKYKLNPICQLKVAAYNRPTGQSNPVQSNRLSIGTHKTKSVVIALQVFFSTKIQEQLHTHKRRFLLYKSQAIHKRHKGMNAQYLHRDIKGLI